MTSGLRRGCLLKNRLFLGMIHTAQYNSPLGRITIASNEHHLIGLWFDGQKHFGSTLYKPYEISDDNTVIEATKRWLDCYFSGEIPDFTPPIELQGTEFQHRVWHELLSIPYGNTLSYQQIAKRISPTMSAQAIGNAVSRNPISIIIPCHRVLSSNGSLAGYAGGLERKRELLRIESQRKRDKYLLCL